MPSERGFGNSRVKSPVYRKPQYGVDQRNPVKKILSLDKLVKKGANAIGNKITKNITSKINKAKDKVNKVKNFFTKE